MAPGGAERFGAKRTSTRLHDDSPAIASSRDVATDIRDRCPWPGPHRRACTGFEDRGHVTSPRKAPRQTGGRLLLPPLVNGVHGGSSPGRAVCAPEEVQCPRHRCRRSVQRGQECRRRFPRLRDVKLHQPVRERSDQRVRGSQGNVLESVLQHGTDCGFRLGPSRILLGDWHPTSVDSGLSVPLAR